MPHPIAFIHLPRTGGSSMGEAIKTRYEGRRYKVKVSAVLPADLAAAIPPRVEIIYGHMPYGLHEQLPVRYATVLREPVSRALSQYRAYQLQKAQRGQAVDMDDFMKSDSWVSVQTRKLSGLPGYPNAESLARAKRHLETFEVVGFFEDLDGFAARIGLATPLPHVDNAGPSPRPDPTPQQLDRIRARNALDTELYEWALAKFGG